MAERPDPLDLILTAEARVEAAVVKAMRLLAAESVRALEQSGYDPAVLDTRWPYWDGLIDTLIAPKIEQVYVASYDDTIAALTAAASVDASVNAAKHLAEVHNRMVGVGDDVFDLIRGTLEEGRGIGEDIPKLSKRVESTLHSEGAAVWRTRGRTVARTEVIGAHNGGAHQAAYATADLLGEDHKGVVKEWVATHDPRTRPTHADASGQKVAGMTTPFDIGGSALQYPGDPSGPGSEVINCRCVVNYLMPGDPGYPEGITAGGTMTTTTYQDAPPADPPEVEPAGDEDEGDAPEATVLVALPNTGDAVHDIGPEEKHATLCFFGDDVPDDVLAAIQAAVDGWVPTSIGPFDANVDGVASLGDDGARVWMIADGSPLADLHDALLELPDVKTAYDAVEQYPTFTPHVTIGYPDDPAADPELAPDVEDAAAAVTSIGFDRIGLWSGGDHQQSWDLPTADTAPADTAPADDPVAAGLRRAMAAEVTPVPVPDTASDIPADGEPWYGILCPEGVLSGDGRRFAEGAITWRDLPLPLMFQEATAFGHDGAVRVARIDGIERDETTYDRPMIRGWGVWDTSEVAAEAKRQVESLMLRGVSVDADDYAAELVDESGDPVDMEDLFFGDVDPSTIIEEATAARICGATLVSIPAFHQAYLANGTRDPEAVEPGQDEGADVTPGAPVELTAAAWSLVAAAVTLPSHALFERPACLDDGVTALTIDGDHIYGHLAAWGTCHIGRDGVCVVPPHSASGYLYFATGVLPTDAGPVAVGQITMDTGHADSLARWRPAAAHYDNTGSAVADITVGEDEHGIWYSGLIRDTADPAKVRDLRASGCLSGDWRDTGGPDLELVAALGVNVGGFPVPRLAVAASAGRQVSLVASGIITPATMAWRTGQAEPFLTATDVRRIAREAYNNMERIARLRARVGRDPASRVLAAKKMIGRDT